MVCCYENILKFGKECMGIIGIKKDVRVAQEDAILPGYTDANPHT